ncbi:MAG: hypothetical protein ACXW30_05820 [Micavibrio sp.]
MNKNNQLPLTEEELEVEAFIKAMAEEKLRQSGFSEVTIKNLGFEIDKFSVAGDSPYYRLAFRAAGSMNQPTEAVKILFLLTENYGVNGGAKMSGAYPVVMTHVFRGDLFAKGTQLAEFLDTILPENVKPQNQPRPPSL